ncbi:carbohydrate kinase [Clostridium perfringens]|uniref:carbohydrate kinase family protein n=1 Tax=Clostridium perfringens TaxID=1502 RepID=UPI0022477A9F|nr:carbohydrate kinase [Clostridium perfringens]MCX0369885.1 carbohydrate kinase [Clostridium perfringens]MDK0795415.1 carbohydrate kinase [Clostridium perfringens]MDM0465702.1 carbohydrate kinase [Clostridium perfringens]MDM0470993.1 carbohydrate kinase [Clostridium perfringens]MDM0474491.1 carbohydrate kinase [Clostridium perfringens]
MKKVLCAGEALIDFVSNKPGASLKDTEGFVRKAGGAPANVAAAISKLGAEAYFCGTVGSDFFGEFLEETFKKNNINTDMMIKLNNKNTTLAFVSLKEDGDRDFRFMRDADSELTFDEVKNKLNQFDLFHFGSATAFLGGELKNTYYKLKDYAKENNKIITFDANYRDALFEDKKEEFVKCCKDFIKDSNIVKLSEEEAILISNMSSIENAAKYIVNLGCENLIITLGKKGALLTTKEKQLLIPTKEVRMVDATGAGDAFIGAVIAQVLNNEKDRSIEEIIEMANFVGGITTTKVGALESIPTWDEVEKNSKINW